MFGSNVLDIAIGLVFLFLLLSLICSAANELLEGFTKQRSANLEEGIKELLGNDANTEAFIQKIYNHGLVNSLFRGNYGGKPAPKLPSYIPAKNFALALLSTVEEIPDKATLPKNVKSVLDTFQKTAANDAALLQKSIEDWYNTGMDRVSGWYKRRSQQIIFVMGLLLAILANADCLQYAQKLSKDASLRQSVVAMAEATAKNNPTQDATAQPVDTIKKQINALDGIGLPIGWSKHYPNTQAEIWNALRFHGLGWLLTALAVSLGAPFWFDMLNKIMVIRSTVKPSEKSHDEASKDPTPTKPDPPDPAEDPPQA